MPQQQTIQTGILFLLASIVAGVLMATGVMIGVHIGSSSSTSPLAEHAMERLKLYANASSGGESVSLATGHLDDGIEALFILDHLNGNLQAWLINGRSNDLGGVYRTNVLAALGGKEGADADLVMTTGNFEFGGRGAVKPAQCIVYVADGTSGNAAAFRFSFNKANIQRGAVEEGEISMICRYPIRNLQLREQ